MPDKTNRLPQNDSGPYYVDSPVLIVICAGKRRPISSGATTKPASRSPSTAVNSGRIRLSGKKADWMPN